MDPQFVEYLFGDLFDHLNQLKECAYSDDPDGDRTEYHYEKAVQIGNRLRDQFVKAEPPIRIVGGDRDRRVQG